MHNLKTYKFSFQYGWNLINSITCQWGITCNIKKWIMK
jgi:hypothetical protein